MDIAEIHGLRFRHRYKVMLLLLSVCQDQYLLVSITDFLAVCDLLNFAQTCHAITKCLKIQSIELKILKQKLLFYQKSELPSSSNPSNILTNFINHQWVKSLDFYNQSQQHNEPHSIGGNFQMKMGLMNMKFKKREKTKKEGQKKNMQPKSLKIEQKETKLNHEPTQKVKGPVPKQKKNLSDQKKKQILMRKFIQRGVPVKQVIISKPENSEPLLSRVTNTIFSMLEIKTVRI